MHFSHQILQRISACSYPPLPPHVSPQLQQAVASALSLDPSQALRICNHNPQPLIITPLLSHQRLL